MRGSKSNSMSQCVQPGGLIINGADEGKKHGLQNARIGSLRGVFRSFQQSEYSAGKMASTDTLGK